MRTAILILFFCLFIWTCGRVESQVPTKADKGVIDFKWWDFTKNGHMELDGQWEFYWNCHLKSKPEICPTSDSKKYISVPGIWNGEIVDGKAITGKGFASYRLQFSLEELNQSY